MKKYLIIFTDETEETIEAATDWDAITEAKTFTRDKWTGGNDLYTEKLYPEHVYLLDEDGEREKEIY